MRGGMEMNRDVMVDLEEWSKLITELTDKDKLLTFNEVVDLLNALHDENEQLKQAYNDAKKDVEKKEQILENIMEHNLLIQYMRNELKE